MAGLSYSDLVTNIRNYTETDDNVLTTAVLENIILNAQYRIFRDVESVGGIAATTISNSSGFTITKTDDNNYTFGAGTNALFSGTGGGGLASAGPVTIVA